MVVVMLDGTLWRIYFQLTRDTKPFDWFNFWVMLAGQIATILLVSIPLFMDYRRGRKRKAWQKSIRALFFRGQQLLRSAPMGGTEKPSWPVDVAALLWEIQAFLERHSPDALPIFLDNTDMPLTINPLIAFSAHAEFSQLVHCIRNLRSIMENAEVYL
jgi:hypothetical protein